MGELDRILRTRRSRSTATAEIIAEICELDDYCQQLYSAAVSDEYDRKRRAKEGKPEDGDNDDLWEKVFDAVFEGGISGKVINLSGKIGQHFDWYDPDTTYEEDATAFINALHEYATGL